ncbi:hypothetical protein PML78_01375 [Enterococcus dispar]|uniref:hypothetical protein n=1 Tax=Enterococcus dispar TaxID=44009 RepID=UPI002330AC50|nr:hypothetical protein [Enterococcus dispar]WCG33366.1 hypothetical protein PML78_01375 [Enterococcus dispar]
MNLGLTIINDNRLFVGIVMEILLLILLICILFFIGKSGKIKKDAWSSKTISKLPLWVSLIICLILMFLTYIGMIDSSIIRF